MGRRDLERKLKGQEKETVTNYDRLELKGNFEMDNKRQCVYSMQYSLDSKYLLVGYGDGCIQVLTFENNKPKIHKELKRKYGEQAITALRFCRKNYEIVYASSADGKVYACNIETKDVREVAEEMDYRVPNARPQVKNEINGMDFNRGGDEFVTGGKDQHVRLYDTESGNLITKWYGLNEKDTNATARTRSHGQRIFCLKYKTDHPQIFFSGGWDNCVKMWDSRLKNAVVKQFLGPHVCGDAIDNVGDILLTGSWIQDNALQLWDVRYNKVLQTLPYNTDGIGKAQDEDTGAYLYCAQFADRHTVLAGGSGTHSIQAISVPDNKVIGELKLHGGMVQNVHQYTKGKSPAAPVKDNVVQALDSTEGGRYLAFGGSCLEFYTASLEGGAERELREEELKLED